MLIFRKKTIAALYYTGIDEMPLFNWNKIHKTNDLGWLFHDYRKLSEKEKHKYALIWRDIFDSFLLRFGISEEMQKIYRLKRDIMLGKIKMVITADETPLAFVQLKEIKLRNILKEAEGRKDGVAKKLIAKSLGFWPKEKDITVEDYYSCLEQLKSDLEANNGG